MGRNGQQRRQIDPDATPAPVFVLEERYASSEGPSHVHRRAQLVHTSEGVVTVRTKDNRWIAPPDRAIWIPGGVTHAVSSPRPFHLLTLYVEPARATLPPDTCRVVAVDRLVAELLRAAVAHGPDYPKQGPEARLVTVLLERLPALAESPMLHLVEPTSAPLRRIAEGLLAEPSDEKTLLAWARVVGLTERTAARRFVQETGTTFARWRQQVRLLAAIEALGRGDNVTQVAFAVGYRDVSSFIAAFKSALGTTPHRYLKDGASSVPRDP